MAMVLSEWPSEIKTRTGTGDLKILDGEDVVVLRRSATDCRQELKSCPPSVRLKLLFVEYILESIKRLPVLSLIFIGYQKLAPCLFMFLIILESSHLLQSKKLLFVLISSISMEFYGIWQIFFCNFLLRSTSKYLFWEKWFKYRLWTRALFPGNKVLRIEHPPIWPISVQFKSYINKKQAYLLTVQPIWLNYSEFFELGEREKYSDKIFYLLLNKYI